MSDKKKEGYTPPSLKTMIDGFEHEVKRAIAYQTNKDKPGMKVPFHGDFAGVNIFGLKRLAWWAREIKAAYERTDLS
jgi:hypothetical protein